MVDRLVEAGQEKVVVVDNLVTGHRAAVHPDAVFYEGDLADQDFMRKVFKENPDVDAVIHFAAYSLVAEFMEKPLKYFDNNTSGMVKLLEVMNECGVKYIVFSSTAATYGIPEEIPILETTPQNPINPYGESKLMMETIMKWSDQAYGIKYVPLRYFNVAGAYDYLALIYRRRVSNLMVRLVRIVVLKPTSCQLFSKWLKVFVRKS